MEIKMKFNDLKDMEPIIFPMRAYFVGLVEENRGYLNTFHNILSEMILIFINSKEPLNVVEVAANLINQELPQDLFVAALEVLYENKMLCNDEFNVFILNAILDIPFERIKRIFDGVLEQDMTLEQLERRVYKIVEEVTDEKEIN